LTCTSAGTRTRPRCREYMYSPVEYRVELVGGWGWVETGASVRHGLAPLLPTPWPSRPRVLLELAVLPQPFQLVACPPDLGFGGCPVRVRLDGYRELFSRPGFGLGSGEESITEVGRRLDAG